jgi:hypothetical protein
MAVLFPLEAHNQFGAMAGVGQEEPFQPTRLSGRYGSESSLLLSRIADRDF